MSSTLKLQIASILASLLLVTVLVARVSSAALTDTTENPGNTWAADGVTLTDDANGTALFDVSGLGPGDTGTECIEVTYEGFSGGVVAMYGEVTDGTLGQYLDFEVERASGADLDCGTDLLSSPFYTGTLDGFVTDNHDFESATTDDSWTAADGDTETYVLEYTVQDDAAAADDSVTATFTWEARLQ